MEKKTTTTTTAAKPENIGVINPYALTETILKKRINWKGVHEPKKLIEATLGMPYEKLFDPKNGSPLYAGLKLNTATKTMVKDSSSELSVNVAAGNVNVAGTVTWADPGTFFNEAVELNDPVQGALGDCYFIAALASVAWARTYVVAQRTRATGLPQQSFVNMIELYKAGKPVQIEVTENLPLNSPGSSYIYCRSSEAAEIWPALYEKAYVFLRKGGSGICDTLSAADYDAIAGGDPVAAISTLTNQTPYYYGNSSTSEADIWTRVRENCISYKTFNPMVAWTYGTSPAGIDYGSAHIVANHAYSILGWQVANNQSYVVLRNPWGSTEATLNIDGSTWIAWDAPFYGGAGWWRPVAFPVSDGVFALRLDTFKKAFAGFGVCK